MKPELFKTNLNVENLDVPDYKLEYKLKNEKEQIKNKEIDETHRKIWDELFPYFVDFSKQLDIPMFIDCKTCEYPDGKSCFVISEYEHITLYMLKFYEFQFDFSEWESSGHICLSSISKQELIKHFKTFSELILYGN